MKDKQPENIPDILRSLDLSKTTYAEVRNILKKLGKVGIVAFTLHRGKNIIRARSNHPNKTFTKVSEISYKPASICTDIQRANSLYRSMFYGCIVSAKEEQNDLRRARETALFETSHLYRNRIDEGEEKITYSRWIVTRDIPLVAIVYHKDFTKKHELLKELNEGYDAFIKTYPPELVQKSIEATEFLAKEFAKEVEQGKNHEYLITAAVADIAVESGYAGVFYPSVPSVGAGFNVAITPRFVENCMMPIVVGECMAYRKGKKFIVDNLNNAELSENQQEFKYIEITDPTIHLGREKMLQMLNSD